MSFARLSTLPIIPIIMDNFDAIFKGVNLLQAFLIVLAGFVDLTDSFKWIIQGVFLILFGSVVGALEVATMDIQPIVQKHASFLFSFMGRGVFSIFLGSLVLSNSVRSSITSAVVHLRGMHGGTVPVD